MIKKLASALARFVTSVRLTLFNTRMEWEIYHRIAPHILGEKDHGYPFASDPQLWKAAHHGNLDILYCIETVEHQVAYMGKAYGKAFRYIMYRDLNRRIRMYAKLAQWRIPPPLRVEEYA